VKRKKKKQFKIHKLAFVFSLLFIFGGVYYFFSRSSVPCANSLSCEESLHLKIENNAVGVFNNRQVRAPNINPYENNRESSVLGTDTSGEEKHIYVDLATQTLSAYEGEKLFMKTLISSGLWGKTPIGEFRIWTKIRSTRMSGGSGADYYNLPNVPYVMFFSNNEVAASRGFSLHGTYWHNNFGHPMSHGCVNMKTTDIAKLYDWANDNPGTKITIFDSSTK
jgi:lipoprotein-anchoring transpeptidase ErfK/SrfK